MARIMHDAALPSRGVLAECGCGSTIYWDVDMQQWSHLPAAYWDPTAGTFEQFKGGIVMCDHPWSWEDGR